MEILGACHCRNISFVLHWPDAGAKIQVRACGCTFCQKHGGVWTSNTGARLIARCADREAVSEYRFGTTTAVFYVCSACGSVPFVVSEIDERKYAVVNVNTFENVEPASLIRQPADFDGESTDTRLGRRQRNWIPDVQVLFDPGS